MFYCTIFYKCFWKRKSLCCHMQEFKSDEVYSNLLENDDNKELLEICLFIYLINKKKKQSICFRQEW